MVTLDLQVQRNLKGIEFEKAGDVEKAVEQYEANIAEDFDGSHPYERLAIIYRRMGRLDDEIRALRKGIQVFESTVNPMRGDRTPKLDKFKERLDKVLAMKGEPVGYAPSPRPAVLNVMNHSEQVDLDRLDGFEFVGLCKRILEKLNYGLVENVVDTADAGEDLIVRGPNGVTIVECKHSPEASIGRPTVQKLHSAVVSSRGQAGLIITTGRFSKTAIEYAEQISRTGVRMTLTDTSLLADMAARAGIHFISGSEHLAVSTYKVFEQESLDRAFAKAFDEFYESQPSKPSEIMEVQKRELKLIPAYELRYDLNAVFKTSVGVVHEEHCTDRRLTLDGEKGNPFRDDLVDFFSGLDSEPFISTTFRDWHPVEGRFLLDSSRITDLAMQEIIRRHTANISYAGGNNQLYTKLCAPNGRQIEIHGLRQVYIPTSCSKVRFLETTHEVNYVDHPSGKINFWGNAVARCNICSEVVKDVKPYLCNVCGSPCHPQKTFSSHGFKCRLCGRTMCRNCTVFKRTLILKRPICPSCADSKKQVATTRAKANPTSRT